VEKEKKEREKTYEEMTYGQYTRNTAFSIYAR
jgi:hypothetical protein